MKESALDKFLKNHKATCACFIFSGDRHCSCGRDEAIKELQELRTARESQLFLFSIPVSMDVKG